MKLHPTQSLKQIAALINCTYTGADDFVISGINEIHKVEPGDLVFVDHPKYYQKCIQSAASFIIINQVTDFPSHKSLLLVKEPFEAYLTIV